MKQFKDVFEPKKTELGAFRTPLGGHLETFLSDACSEDKPRKDSSLSDFWGHVVDDVARAVAQLGHKWQEGQADQPSSTPGDVRLDSHRHRSSPRWCRWTLGLYRQLCTIPTLTMSLAPLDSFFILSMRFYTPFNQTTFPQVSFPSHVANTRGL
ncbi:hypothetical protein WMY93_005522 [Mugilogobius chulae]|uniref:Uncharacterized protein n=1 Tax=Mugilogobius chulae TaxID=88201 RepID=A0AAW0PK04_9GOBI